MQVRVLGPFELLGADDRSLDIGGPKERAVLAMLALHANQVVSEDRLADALWGDAPPRTADRTLQVYLSRIRKVLKDAGSDGSIALESSHAGWTLSLAPEALDLTAVEAQIARGRTAAAADDPLGAALAFADALRAWRGRPLDEFADRAWAVTEATRLAELRLLVVEERIEAELTAGRHTHVIGELEGICREHPLRERPWGQRMLALYRSGRQAEALRVYQDLRTVLTDELGIEPSPAVARLEQAILAHDPGLELPTPAAAAASAPSGLAALLFTDLVGSTELLGRIGDEAFDAVRREHFEALRATIAEAGGREVKSLGDGLMAAFPSVLTACSCAVALQRRTARQNRRPGVEPLRVRVGLDVGETTQEGDDHFGTVVVTAKRLCDVAGAGEIVASRFVAELVSGRGGFTLHELAPVELKGFTDTLTAFSVAWEEDPMQGLPPVLVSLRPARFVGRGHELSVLDAAWARARDGARQVVLIAGEPGIGKTALAQHVAERAAATGAMVLFGRCDEESVVPFQPFREALGHHCSVTAPDELRRQLGDQAKDLALLVPGLDSILPELGGVAGTGAENERFRIFEVARSLFATLQAEGPMVLVLDDLHWADRPTLQLLQHLLRGDAASSLLVIGTYRDTDLVRTHPLAEVLVELRRANLVDRLPLRGLTIDDVEELVGHQALAETLWRETEGSPLFLREILRHLEETGAIEATDDHSGYAIHRRLDQLGVPEGVREVIGRRLSRLSEDANHVLRLGSVQGRELRLDVLQRIADLDESLVLDALEQATVAGLVDEHPTALGRWSFTHALVRQALYDELSLTRRVLVHQHVGEALEAIHGAGDGPHLAELAHHYTQAAIGGTAAKAIAYGRRAGELAVRQAAYEQGTELFATALEVAHDLGAERTEVADLLLAQADATSRGGDPRAARVLGQRVVDLVGDQDPERLARAAIMRFGDDVRTIPIEFGRLDREGIALVERALAELPGEDHPIRARLLGVLARAYALYDPPQHVLEAADEAVAMARRLGDKRALIVVLYSRTLARYVDPADTAWHVEVADEALALALDLDEVHLRYIGHVARLVALFELNRIDEARQEIETAAAVLAQTRSPYDLQQLTVARIVMAIHEGRFEEAERLIEDGYAIGQEVRDHNTPVLFGAAILALRVMQGRAAELLPLIEQVGQLMPDQPDLAALLAAFVAAKAGLLDEARRLVDDHPTDRPAAGLMRQRSAWTYRAETYELLAESALAGKLYEEMLPYEDQVCSSVLIGHGTVAEALGRCAATAGRDDVAEWHFNRALVICAENGWAASAAQVQARLATLLAGRADDESRARAVELGGQALAEGERIGMEHVRTEARTVLHLLAGGPPPAPTEAVTATRRDRLRALLLGWGRAGVARWTRDHTDEDLVRRFGTHRAQRAVLGTMARAFQPATAFGFEGEIEFELLPPDDHVDPTSSDWWTLEVGGRRASAREGRATNAAVTLHIGVADFIRLGAGELRPLDLLEARRARIEGQLDLGIRIPSMFGLLEAGSLGTAS